MTIPTDDTKPKRPRGRPPKSKVEKTDRISRPEPREDLPELPDDAPSDAVRIGQPPVDSAFVVPADKRVVIGITGEPGAGKSALSRQLAALGGTLIDVDQLGHELIETPRIKRDLVNAFGDDILNGEGEIDRRAVAAKAFISAEGTAKLNSIVHPKLTSRTRALVAKFLPFVVIDAALLHELGLGDLCTTSIYVKASREARTARVAERGWDEAELARREAALNGPSGTPDARRKACQLAVDNSGDPSLLTAYAKTILARQIGLDLSQLKKQQPAPQRVVEDRASDDDGESGDNSSTSEQEESGDSQNNEAPRQEQRPQREQRDQRDGREPRGEQRDGREQRGDQREPRDGRDGRDQQRGFAPRGQNGQNPQQGGNNNGQGGGQNPDNRPPVRVVLDDYLNRKLPDLQAEADKLEVRDVKWLKKADLICEIFRRVAAGRQDEIVVEGYMEIIKEQGYIRSTLNSYAPTNTDTFITIQQLRRYGLKPGMQVTGVARAPRGNEKCPQLLSITQVMGEPENARTAVQDFEHLIPLHASDRLFMELPNDPTDYSLRIIDLVAPIGKGQRGLIVAQPKCGKTVYLQKIAKAITTNNPEVILMVLLVDERPEEVTDMQRSVRGEVIASTFDQHASRHVQCAEMVINKAKRLVERGKDVVILLDSITRLARAYNTEAPNSGRILSGGIDSNALIKPKQFFGAARKIEDGGSLTILATALTDTGSLMDTVIFEEFKGTGNMELVLDRRLANKRVFPAVDCGASGTRKDELIIKTKDELTRVWALRRFLAERSQQDAVEFLKGKLSKTKTNIEFLLTLDPDKMSGSW
jgi:transcription termination factor Rho